MRDTDRGRGRDKDVDREAIWSVPARWQKAFFWLFTIKLAICSGWIIWYHVWQKTGDTRTETFIAIGHDIGGFILPITASTYISVEVGFMLSEVFLKGRYNKGKEDGLEEGVVKGRAEGQQEGSAIARKELQGTGQAAGRERETARRDY